MQNSDVFYPQHFRKTRPYVKGFAEDVEALLMSGKADPRSCMSLSAKHIFGEYKKHGIAPTDRDFDTQGFTVENQAALVYAEWARHGAATYVFKEPLVDALLATDVNDVKIWDLEFPFDCVYFHFGARPDLLLQSGAPVTGAYLLWSRGLSLRVVLTAPLPESTLFKDKWAETYDLRLLPHTFHLGLEDAIERALADDLDDLKDAAKKVAAQNHPMAAASVATTEAFIRRNEANHATFTKCLQLIASALCYVEAYPSDASTTWQVGTPAKLREKAETAAPKEAGRAASKLNAMGYRKVRYIGGQFAEAAERSEGAEAGHRDPHMRRAHWRWQAHGPKMSLRKLIRVQATRVLGGVFSTEPRVYSTAPAN